MAFMEYMTRCYNASALLSGLSIFNIFLSNNFIVRIVLIAIFQKTGKRKVFTQFHVCFKK